jgi:5-formyltetrahydrofolate cyclo-ligase
MEQPSKASLRRQARNVLAALSVEARAEASAEICRRIEILPEWANARTVAFYAAQSSEPDLSALLDARGKTLCFPRVSGEVLEFHRCESKEHLRAGPWKLLEPDPQHCPEIPAGEIDLIFVPGLAFTRTGGRLGRGGGFYDRFLAGVRPRAVKLGICFHAQIVAALPLESHDHEVDQVVSETAVFRCRA